MIIFCSCFANSSFDEPSIGVCIPLATQIDGTIPLIVHLMTISSVFIALTLIIYIKIKTLRAPEDVAFMISIGCLGAFFVANVLQQWFRNVDALRNVLYQWNIFLGPALIVGYFSWLNVIMFNQLRKNM